MLGNGFVPRVPNFLLSNLTILFFLTYIFRLLSKINPQLSGDLYFLFFSFFFLACSKCSDLEEELKNVTNNLKSLEAQSEKVGSFSNLRDGDKVKTCN